jgi:hypothetical protein
MISVPIEEDEEDCPEPTFTPSEKLCPGSYIYHDGTVRLSAGIICLFVGKPLPLSNRLHD